MASFPYRLDHRLIVIPVILHGRQGSLRSEFILDTGASLTVVDHSLASALGYSARDGIGLSNVSSAVGRESGYRLVIKGMEALGKSESRFEVICHDLIDEGVEGLIGMSFLGQFGWCVDPAKQVILIR